MTARVANDAVPGARSVVADVVPGSEKRVGVGESELDAL